MGDGENSGEFRVKVSCEGTHVVKENWRGD